MASKKSSRYWDAVALAVALLLAGGVFLGLTFINQDPDMYWHLKTGQWIVDNGIPRTDPFTWYGIERSLEWVNHEWLFDVGAWGLFSLGGLGLLRTVTGLLSGLMAWLLYRLLRLRSGSGGLGFGVMLLSLPGLFILLTPRPQVLSYVLVLGFMLLLEHRKWWWALPLVVLDVNAHGGFWIAYLLIGAYYAWKEKPLFLAAVVGMSLLNPYTWKMTLYPFVNQGYAPMRSITEWHPVTLTADHLPWVLALALMAFILTRGRPRWTDLAAAGVFTLLALSAVRHVIFVYLVALPWLVPYLPAALAGVRDDLSSWRAAGGRAAAAYGRIADRYGKGQWEAMVKAALPLALAAAALGLAVTAGSGPAAGVPAYGNEEYLAWMQEHRPELGRLLNDYSDGGWMGFYDLQPMIDGRADVFSSVTNEGETLFEDYTSAVGTGANPWGFYRKYGIETVAAARTSIVAAPLMGCDDFEVLYDDGTMVVFRVPERLREERTP